MRNEQFKKNTGVRNLLIEVTSEGYCQKRYISSKENGKKYHIPRDTAFIQVDGVDIVRENGYSYGRGDKRRGCSS